MYPRGRLWNRLLYWFDEAIGTCPCALDVKPEPHRTVPFNGSPVPAIGLPVVGLTWMAFTGE